MSMTSASGEGSRRALEAIVEHIGHILPAQGPISVFVHHNTLHAFEGRPFEDATVEAGRLFDCEPFLLEDRYRAEFRAGRIAEGDVDAMVDAELGRRGDEEVVPYVQRRDLWRRILLGGISDLRGVGLEWVLRETAALTALRDDLPRDALESLAPYTIDAPERDAVAVLVGELWRACQGAVERSTFRASAAAAGEIGDGRLPRLRDLLWESEQIDLDEWVHRLLIRVTSAYLDQGLADWEFPERRAGLYRAFVELYRGRLARLGRPHGKELQRLLLEEQGRGWDASASLEHSLEALGVGQGQWEPFLMAEALALPGWAGMVRQFEERPDRVPSFAIEARLVDFLAVRLLIVRAALAHAARVGSLPEDPTTLRSTLEARIGLPAEPTIVDRAWPVFQAAQLCGLDASVVDGWDVAQATCFEQVLADFDSLTRRRILHLAYERHLRHRLWDAMVQHSPEPTPTAPAYQLITCIDEREESFRRHLEEVDPEVETLGAAGFFGVAMYYRAATDAHPRPLCPVSVTPVHCIREAEGEGPRGLGQRLRRAFRRMGALVDKNVHVGSRQFGRGAVIMASLGVLWLLPLVFRVLFPWGRRGALRLYAQIQGPTQPRLQLDRSEETPHIGRYSGFTVEEMAAIVRGQLAPIGILERLAPMVVVLGHGSTSLNNPHASAYDCGACGGGRGGPNARAFAQMANDPRVRAKLAEEGVVIPDGTVFVGGQRNTANNDVDLYDEDWVPEHARPLLDRLKRTLPTVREREAHERCRRFESASLELSPRSALIHVQARATDLAQPRSEYGHGTNAFCVIGRRARTRGLFLDRRSFLVSYDPARDPDGDVLEAVLAAVVPVVAGINLEYFFGCVDQTGYGSGTKLPHNITGLVGVMDGAKSDLRTGLPAQTLEIHEPVRLSIVVESPAEVLARVVNGNETLRRLVHNRWIYLAALDPEANTLYAVDARGATPYTPERPLRRVRGESAQYYRGRRGHLPVVGLVSGASAGGV